MRRRLLFVKRISLQDLRIWQDLGFIVVIKGR